MKQLTYFRASYPAEKDNVICSSTYGMYEWVPVINKLESSKSNHYQLRFNSELIKTRAVDKHTKIHFILLTQQTSGNKGRSGYIYTLKKFKGTWLSMKPIYSTTERPVHHRVEELKNWIMQTSQKRGLSIPTLGYSNAPQRFDKILNRIKHLTITRLDSRDCLAAMDNYEKWSHDCRYP